MVALLRIFHVKNSVKNPAKITLSLLQNNTLLIKLEPVAPESEDEDEGNELILSLFLDFITKDALKNRDRLEAYTEAMAQEDDELLAGVALDP